MVSSARVEALLGRERELAVLQRVLDSARDGDGGVLVVHGDPGVGKTALLEHAAQAGRDFRVIRTTGVEGEEELDYAAVQQLCSPILELGEHLPDPQREALDVAFGRTAGSAPNSLFFALAVLSLLSDAAEQKPLLCVIDDAQWLDAASARALAFVGRRLLAERIVLAFATRDEGGVFARFPQLEVKPLGRRDARALLESVLAARLDEPVLERIVAETGGNALAILELPRGLTPAQLAGGFGLPSALPLSAGIEHTFRRRLARLPPDARRFLLLAAAEPLGDPALLWRSARLSGIPETAAQLVESEGLLTVDGAASFRHPLVRSAAYSSASAKERQDVHRALAEVTDPGTDPDRYAWHRGQAAVGPDEEVAEELDRSAARAQARGGLAAAAAFLERSAELTLEPGRRGDRLLAAARAKRDTGAFDSALRLLVTLETEQLDAHSTAEAEHLRGQIALEQQQGGAVRLLLSAAGRLAALDVRLARETYLEALVAALWAGDLHSPGGMLAAAEAARTAPAASEPPHAVDVVLDALAIRVIEGYEAAAPLLRRALELLLAQDPGSDEPGRSLWLATSRWTQAIAAELWDADAVDTLATRQLERARDAGALVQLRLALNFLGGSLVQSGELAKAEVLFDEDRLVAEATGNQPVTYNELLLAVWRGQEAKATELLEATAREARTRGMGRFVSAVTYLESVFNNSLGRYDAARGAAWQVFERDDVGFGPLIVAELAEAASRTGDHARLEHAGAWLAERMRTATSGLASGIDARVRALLSNGDAADNLYRESIVHLSGTRVRLELARTQLLYGEWLRRERRRRDARLQLRTALEAFTAMGADGFARRAERELLVTGERARKRTVVTRDQLTPQETQIARLVADGHTNREIAAQLFISPSTVEYHLRKVFRKLGVTSRTQLAKRLRD